MKVCHDILGVLAALMLGVVFPLSISAREGKLIGVTNCYWSNDKIICEGSTFFNAVEIIQIVAAAWSSYNK